MQQDQGPQVEAEHEALESRHKPVQDKENTHRGRDSAVRMGQGTSPGGLERLGRSKTIASSVLDGQLRAILRSIARPYPSFLYNCLSASDNIMFG